MAENMEGSIKALMSSLENFVSTKTIIGEPVQYRDIVVFPMADVSFGVAAGASNKDSKNSGAGGAGAKITPSAVLVIQNGTSKIVNIKDKDSVNKLIEMVPDLINKLSAGLMKSKKDEEVVDIIEDEIDLNLE